MKKLITVFALLAASIFNIYADTITEVEYKGLWRTKESYIKKQTGELTGKNFQNWTQKI